MEDKLNTLLDRLMGAFDKWLTDFETHPVQTAIKVALVVWLVKVIRRNLK